MKELIIFGTADIAQLAYYYFSNDSDYKIAAFTVDAQYMRDNEFCGLPVVPFKEVTHHYPPEKYDLFVALGYSRLNRIRKEKYLVAKSLGYRLASYISSQATILNDFRIGENCFILEDSIIQPFVTIGNNVTLWSGSLIAHHATIHDHSFLCSRVVVSGGVEIGEACFIGANATLRDHIKLGEKCVIGAGALIMADAESEGVYIGQATKRAQIISTQLKKI
jgi:sugar O-acyltransferase (sialic acid O-acetyltransferase NeuD family)